MTEVAGVAQRLARRSAASSSELLTTPGIKQADVEQRLAGLVAAAAARTSSGRRSSIRPARCAPRTSARRGARSSASTGLPGSPTSSSRRRARTTRPRRARCSRRRRSGCVASDVVWEDLFRAPAVAELAARRTSPASTCPTRSFVQTRRPRDAGVDGADLAADPRRVDRRHADRPARHGHRRRRACCRAARSCAGSDQNTIPASTDLAFEVSVTDTGDAQEVRVEVTLTIQQSPSRS